jgi:hypothetical protein
MLTITKCVVRLLRPASIVMACGMVVLVSVNRIMPVFRAAPAVGDMLVFGKVPTTDADDIRLLVHRRDRFGCVLDLNVLRHSGGSLIIEATTEAGADDFRVHWAGQRTSGDTGNCGGEADLLVDHRDLEMLALAAGGFEAGARRAPIVVSAVGY